MTTKAKNIKKSQQRNLLIIVSLALSMTLVVYWLVADDTEQAHTKDTVESIDFEGPLNKVDESDVLLERIQNRLDDSEHDKDKLQKQLQQLQMAHLAATQQGQQQNKSLTQLNDEISQLKNEWQELKTKTDNLATNQNTVNAEQSATAQNTTPGYGPRLFPKSESTSSSDTAMQQRIIPESLATGIRDDQLSLSSKSPAHHQDKNHYVPPGTFIKAVMLGGADAAASPTSQSNPTPMLFRLIGEGSLPNGMKSNLKNCVVTAAVIGDISAERGLIRTERLSCTRPNGHIIDVAIKGTVFGPSGKNGVRGEPLWREQSLLARAAVAGTLGGISDGLSQSFTTQSISPLGSTKSVNSSKIFQYGAARGASSALDKLAEYNIKRAEQYHPVIQLGAGTLVDIVILKGFYLNEGEEAPSLDESISQSDSTPSIREQATTEANAILARLPNHA